VGHVTQPTPLEKAEAAARDAAANTDVVRIVAAVLATQQATQQQPAPAPPQATPAPRRIPASYVALAIVGAGAVTALAMAAALLAVAVAIGGVCATVCLLVLRSMWRDIQKGNCHAQLVHRRREAPHRLARPQGRQAVPGRRPQRRHHRPAAQAEMERIEERAADRGQREVQALQKRLSEARNAAAAPRPPCAPAAARNGPPPAAQMHDHEQAARRIERELRRYQ
jgi:hypothetical protein